MTGHKFKNLAAQSFNGILVLFPVKIVRGSYCWLCICFCGRPFITRGNYVENGHTRSCGCLSWTRHFIHGKGHSRVYKIYYGMKKRCNNPKEPGFYKYGGRGIRCEFTSFEEFYAEVGDPPGPEYSIDRKENNGNYAPGNVRWATRIEQARNTRRTIWMTFKNRTLTLMQWAEETDIAHDTLRARRFRYGWSIEKTLTEAVRHW